MHYNSEKRTATAQNSLDLRLSFANSTEMATSEPAIEHELTAEEVSIAINI